MAEWIFNKTPQFVRSIEEVDVSDKVVEAIGQWALSVPRVQTNRTKRWFCSPHNIFEIWTARIPNPDSNKGKSGGFRLIYFFLLTEGSIHVDRMEQRADLGGRDERPREQKEFTEYLETLKLELTKEFEHDGDEVVGNSETGSGIF